MIGPTPPTFFFQVRWQLDEDDHAEPEMFTAAEHAAVRISRRLEELGGDTHPFTLRIGHARALVAVAERYGEVRVGALTICHAQVDPEPTTC